MLKLSSIVLNASVLLVPFRHTGVTFQYFLAWHAFKGSGCTFYFSMARKPPVGQGLLIVEASRSHSRHTTLGRNPLDGWKARCKDLYLTTHNTHQETDIHAPGRIRTHKPVAADSCLRPRGHRDRQAVYTSTYLTYETRFERMFGGGGGQGFKERNKTQQSPPFK